MSSIFQFSKFLQIAWTNILGISAIMPIDEGHLWCYDSELYVSLLYPQPKKRYISLCFYYTDTYNTEYKQVEASKDTNITGKHILFVSIFLLDT